MSKSRIFSGFGIEIFIREGRYFIRYDAGELVVLMREIEVSQEEAARAQIDEKNAYDVILTCEKKYLKQ